MGHWGSVSYSQRKRRDPHEEAVAQFAREAVQFLEKELLKKNFQSLTLVAEPHLLGIIRAEMSASLKKTVTDWMKKDLQKTPKNKLASFLVPQKAPPAPFLS